ncbi:hypothetical protein EV182_000214 [Spiromyces aspiralis]|uniref:Uncharacterized protein n=1 Tax=Spiromyces aspiralis TaxID=68401 RepID=A0ACC1HJV6_9FUNG|nr:hypothetical protein EV182_000214 [Spiromyces aspiralis]
MGLSVFLVAVWPRFCALLEVPCIFLFRFRGRGIGLRSVSLGEMLLLTLGHPARRASYSVFLLMLNESTPFVVVSAITGGVGLINIGLSFAPIDYINCMGIGRPIDIAGSKA